MLNFNQIIALPTLNTWLC